MSAQITSTSIDWSGFDTETVTITRSVASATLPVTYSTLTLYSGAGDFQNAAGASLAYNPSGAVDSTTAILILEPDVNGNYPAILPDDIVTVAGTAYAVSQTTAWNVAPKHLEISLKRGPVPYGKT